MAFTVTESARGHSYQVDSPPGEFSMTMYFDAVWDGNDSINDSTMLNTIAAVRSRVPVGYQYNTLFKSLVAREVTATQIEDSQGCWRVAVRYSTREGFIDGVFCMVTRSTQTRQAAQYRKTASGFGWVATGSSTTADIGGDKVDINGIPRNYEVPQTLITVDTYWDRTSPNGNPKAEPPYANYTALVNQRNNAVFIGYPVGSVRYLGFQSAPVDNYYRIQHTFLFDAWLHSEQIPVPNPTGQPILVAGSTLGTFATLQVASVIEYQKYTTGAISGALTAAQLSELTAPQPNFPA